MIRLLLFISCVIPAAVLAQSFTPTSDLLAPTYEGKMKWADIDNDGDLDILYSGFKPNGNGGLTVMYENINGQFTERGTSLPVLRNGVFALGDFDNDGDLDVLMSGLSTAGQFSALYENTGAFGFTLKQSFQPLINTSVSWADIDNDGDLDFFLGGDDHTNFVNVSYVYENQNGNFSLLSNTNLPPCMQCSMDWADANGDGKIDVALVGFMDGYAERAAIYLNNGNKTFTHDTSASFRNLFNGDIKWGDFDNDGDNDILLSGPEARTDLIYTTVYENTGTSWQERADILLHGVGENWLNGTAWTDFNNDGYLDIILSGRGISLLDLEYNFKFYENDQSGNFQEVTVAGLPGMSGGSVDFGDFDNDGDIDFGFDGMTPQGAVAGVYRNELLSGAFLSNDVPSPPDVSTLSETMYRKNIRLRWGDGQDGITPSAGLSYNFYLRNAAGKIVSPAVDFATGFIRSEHAPNGQGKNEWMNDVPEGPLYWAVQTVDGGKKGSPFSSEKSFYHINGPGSVKAEIVDVENVKLSWIDHSLIEDHYRIFRSTNSASGFTEVANLPANTSTAIDTYSFLTDTYYYYRIYAYNASNASAYDSLRVLIPTAPGNAQAVSVNASTITLTWNDLSDFETGYVVERKKSTSSMFQVITTENTDVTTFSDTELEEGTIYEYRVRAINAYGSSAFSNTASAKTNFRPMGSNVTKTFPEDETFVFAVGDFEDRFADQDTDDHLHHLVIGTLPQKGSLTINGNAVTQGQSVANANLSDLTFTPPADVNGNISFNFYFNDGKDNSAATYAVTLDITPVNDPPAFTITALLEADEDFSSAIKVKPAANPAPADEQSQVLSYTVEAVTDVITFGYDAGNGEITLTSVQDRSGEVEFTITANDSQADHNTYTQNFTLVIKPVNDPPVLSAIGDLEVELLDPVPPAAFTVNDVDDDLSAVVVTSASSSQQIVQNDKITMEGSGTERVLQIIPEANERGETVITISASDGKSTASTAFTLTRYSSIMAVPEMQGSPFEIYPNPVVSKLSFRSDSAVPAQHEMVLCNLLGKQVMTAPVHPGSEIDVSSINTGIYLLVIHREGREVHRQKIAKR